MFMCVLYAQVFVFSLFAPTNEHHFVHEVLTYEYSYVAKNQDLCEADAVRNFELLYDLFPLLDYSVGMMGLPD